MLNVVELNGVRLYAHHGCLPEETAIGGHYTVDVAVYTDFTRAAETDELIDTVDYVVLNRIVKEEMAIPSKLIEHVGKRILDRVYGELKSIQRVKVKITKICPPINGDVNNVSIIIEA